MRERIAVTVASLLVALGVYNGANVMLDHLASPDFPEHAKFHAALGGAYLVLVSLLAAVIAWTPRLRRVGRGLLLAGVLLTIPLGFLVAVAIVPAGSPGTFYVVLAVTGMAMAVIVGLLLVQAH